jgi:hypothetical protein
MCDFEILLCACLTKKILLVSLAVPRIVVKNVQPGGWWEVCASRMRSELSEVTIVTGNDNTKNDVLQLSTVTFRFRYI